MPTTRTTDANQVWERYSQLWSMTDPAEREAAMVELLAPDCVYTDPTTRATGHAEIGAYMDDFQDLLPGGGFEVTGFAAHHAQSLAEWNMVAADGTVAGTGASHATYSAGGMLTSMTGFFDVPTDG